MVKGLRSLPRGIVLQYAQNRLNQSVTWCLGECAQQDFIGPWAFHPRRHSRLPGLEIRAVERIRKQLGGLNLDDHVVSVHPRPVFHQMQLPRFSGASLALR
jgi:hypothetical protein